MGVKKGMKLGCNIVAVGKFHRYGVRVNYWFQNGPATPLHPLTPLFKTFLVYAREIVLLTQFSVTRFRVNRAGARVRNNSLLKWCSINELPISFSISSNRTFSVSMGKKKGRNRDEIGSTFTVIPGKRKDLFVVWFIFSSSRIWSVVACIVDYSPLCRFIRYSFSIFKQDDTYDIFLLLLYNIFNQRQSKKFRKFLLLNSRFN